MPIHKRPLGGMAAAIEEPKKPEEITLSIPEAGKRYFGLSRNGSYAAAERGDIPTIRVGKLRRVPIKVLERRIEALAR